MDQERFERGKSAYAEGDWRTAAQAMLSAVEPDAEKQGEAYRLAGNALVKLGRHADATTVYLHALEDPTLRDRAGLLTNLGVALTATDRSDEALGRFEEALAVPNNRCRYKALQCIARIRNSRKDFEGAAAAYREAVLDDANPDPGRALNNMGLAYMNLGRPLDAIAAYKAALDMSGYAGKGKAASNLGLAYSVVGRHEKCVVAFERAVDEFGHELSQGARIARADALHELTKLDAGEQTPASAEDRSTSPNTAGNRTEPLSLDPNDVGIDAPVLGAELDEESLADVRLSMDEDGVPVDLTETRFFDLTDDDMRTIDRAARKADRAGRRTGRVLAGRIIITVAVVLVLAAGLFTLLYLGFGWPTQEATVSGMFDAYAKGESVKTVWIAAPATDVARLMASVPPDFRSYTIDSVERSATSSNALVTVTLERGAPLHYEVQLSREGVGWKVSGLKNDWRSQN